jgi:Protein of unknown function (DUF3108)
VRNRFACLLLALFGVNTGVLAASAELRPFQASFNVVWRGMAAGTSHLELQHLDDGRWSYRSRSNARGLFRLAMSAELSSRSIFSVRDGRIVPELFTADDGADSNNKDQSLTFNWEQGRVTGVVEKQKVDLPITAGLQDTMSVQVALMQELLAGRTPHRFQLLDKTKLKEYTYTSEGDETLRTPVGEYRTMLFRSSRAGSTSSTYFWCAPELGFLPLKVERRDGKKVQWSMSLQSLRRSPT